jgi:hypothetical protein
VAAFLLAELSAPRNKVAFTSENVNVSSALNPLETSESGPAPLSALLNSLSSASALGAGTLLLLGSYRKLRQIIGGEGGGNSDESGGKFYPKKRGEQFSPLVVVEKAVGAMVPYFAAIELGAVRTAAIVLSISAGGLIMAGRAGDIKGMVTSKKGALGAIIVGVVYDLWRSSELENGLCLPPPCFSGMPRY